MSHTIRRAAALGLLAGALIAPAQAAAQSSASPSVTVMSRNLYLGADLIPIVLAQNPQQLEQRATELFGKVQQTNFPLRAKRLAAEVRRERPDLIGIQELTTYRRGPKDGGLNASEVVYDWYASLQRELRARGLRYRLVRRTTTGDEEVGTDQNVDLRITIGDAVLVRNDRRAKVSIRRVTSGAYNRFLAVALANGQQGEFRRTWITADARVAGRSFRFVNTHLEAFGDEIREAQARQLVSQPLRSRRTPTILVGDLNSDPRDAAAQAASYRAVVGAGFTNAFNPLQDTSGFNELVNDADNSGLDRSIDHILTRPRFRTVDAEVVGDSTAEKINGLWPSDHAGVVAKLRLPRR